MSLDSSSFEIYRDFLFKESGLIISPDKTYLLDSRLSPVLREHDLEDMNVLAQKIKLGTDPTLKKAVVEAMTTNETSFFRDQKPFDYFTNFALPKLLQSRASSKKIRIWCAACSSGQEPYSLAILLKEQAAKMAGWRVEIVATDLDEKILDQARKGRYSQFEVQRGMPIQTLVKYFTQDGDSWLLNDDVKSMVTFKKFNLLDSFTLMGKYDIVFCRNVLIYFDTDTKKKVFEKIDSILENDGYLFLGGAETVLGITEAFKPVAERGGGYVKTGQEKTDSVSTLAS